MRRWLWAVMGWLVLLGMTYPSQAQETFRFKFEPGTVWVYTTTAKGQGNLEIANPQAPDAGVQTPLDMQMDMKMEQLVESVDPQTDVAKVAVRMPGMNITIQVMGQSIEMKFGEDGMRMFVNGQEMGGQPGMPNLADLPLFGKPMHLEISSSGKVVKVEPINLGNLMGPQMPMLQNLQTMQQPQNWFVPFPETPIAVGDTWQQEQEFPIAPGAPPFKVKTSYRFDGWENVRDIQCAKILMKVTFEAKDLNLQQPQPPAAAATPEPPAGEGNASQPEAQQPPADQPQMPMPTIHMMKLEMEGPIYFNLDAGRIERSVSDMKMEMDMAMGDEAGGMSFTMDMTMKTEMELAEVKRAEI